MPSLKCLGALAALVLASPAVAKPEYREYLDGTGIIVELVADFGDSVTIKICGQETYFTVPKKRVGPTELTCKYELDLQKTPH